MACAIWLLPAPQGTCPRGTGASHFKLVTFTLAQVGIIHPALTDAIKFTNGDTIATAGVTLTLFSGLSEFEAKLDGYKAHFLDLRSQEAIDRGKQHTKLFEAAICGFMTDGIPAYWRLVTPYWLMLDGGIDAAEYLIRGLTWLPGSTDPFEIGATTTRSKVNFVCSNTEELWTVGITMDKSALVNAHLFLEISCEYRPGSHYDTFDKKAEHLSNASRVVADKLGLILE